MKLEEFLGRLSKLRQTGRDSWIAACPAHDDQNPSLTVGVGSENRVLVHCFANCSPEDVVAAVGMDLSDLMPDGPATNQPLRRVLIPVKDVLEAMAINAMTVAIAASDMAQGKQLTTEEKGKLFAIAGDFQEAIEFCGATRLRDELLKKIPKCN